MARITPLEYDATGPDVRPDYDAQIGRHGRMTNMKKTLGRSPAALRALMTWYDLREAVVPFLGERSTTLFAHAISAQTDCLICSTFFRRMLIEAGENPDELRLDDRDRAIVDFGRAIAKDPNNVSDAVYAGVRNLPGATDDGVVALTAFAAMMIATNIFNNVLRVDLDEYLYAFRKR